MIKKQLPDFIFKKNYDNFFLFTEYDIIFNDIFYEKLISFVRQLKGKYLTMEIENIGQTNTKFNSIIQYTNPKQKDLENFYEINIELDSKTFPIHYINHFIRDNNNEWELYVSIEHEISIFGCNNVCLSQFLNIFEPYEEEPLSVKKKIIGDMFNDNEERIRYMNMLETSYKFSMNE